MRSPLHLAAFALFVATLPACTAVSLTGDAPSESGSDGSAEAAACGPVFDAYIAFADRCGYHARGGYIFRPFPDTSEPDPAAKGNFQATCAALAKRRGDRHTVAMWKRCEETLRNSATCDGPGVWEACGAIAGGRKNGEACASNDECASRSCSAEDTGGKKVVACGVCQPMGAAGDECGDSSGKLPPCGEGLHCNHKERMCVELHSRGQDEACSHASECAEGLICDYDRYRSSSFCKPGRTEASSTYAAGDRCSVTFGCSSGLTCQDGACVVNRAEAGGLCSGALCPSGYACARSKGDDERRCRPVAQLGESCSTRPCAAFLTCSESSKCVLPVQACHE